MKVKCPVLVCPYVVEVEAINKMLEHLKKQHTIAELWELIEHCVVEHFEKEVSGNE